jgi:hypothetical protein
VETLHLIMGIAVLASNLVAGVWGAVCWYLRKPSVPFWYLLRFAQVTVVLQVAIGGLLLLLGNQAADLHYLYGVLPVVVSLLGEGARTIANQHEMEGLDFDALPKERKAAVVAAIVRRETGIMAVSSLVIFGLALRAAFLQV